MRGLQAFAGLAAIVASVWLLRVVYHAWTDHAHLDVFHLFVGVGSAAVGLIILQRAIADRKVGRP